MISVYILCFSVFTRRANQKHVLIIVMEAMLQTHYGAMFYPMEHYRQFVLGWFLHFIVRRLFLEAIMLICRPFPCNSIANINNLIRIERFEYLIFLRRALVYSSMETILYVFLRLVVHEQGVT